MAQVGWNYEKNWRSKISLDCPFNHYTIEVVPEIADFSNQLSFLHKNSWDNSQVEPGKYTSNCRETKAGVISS